MFREENWENKSVTYSSFFLSDHLDCENNLKY